MRVRERIITLVENARRRLTSARCVSFFVSIQTGKTITQVATAISLFVRCMSTAKLIENDRALRWDNLLILACGFISMPVIVPRAMETILREADASCWAAYF